MKLLRWITLLDIITVAVYGIYGGERVFIDKFPFQASVQIRSQHICGAVIISNREVLTAANCVLAESNVVYGNIQVLVGTHDIDDYQFGRIHQVSYVIHHELYNPRNNWINDIAILKLETQLFLVKRLCLPAQLPSKKAFARRNHHVIGWGIDPILNELSTHLQRFEVRLINPKHCKSQYYQEHVLSESQYCFFPFLASAGMSQGGGGSPIMYGRQISGIVSLDSLNINQPIIYTHVFEYNHWIQDMMTKM